MGWRYNCKMFEWIADDFVFEPLKPYRSETSAKKTDSTAQAQEHKAASLPKPKENYHD